MSRFTALTDQLWGFARCGAISFFLFCLCHLVNGNGSVLAASIYSLLPPLLTFLFPFSLPLTSVRVSVCQRLICFSVLFARAARGLFLFKSPSLRASFPTPTSSNPEIVQSPTTCLLRSKFIILWATSFCSTSRPLEFLPSPLYRLPPTAHLKPHKPTAPPIS